MRRKYDRRHSYSCVFPGTLQDCPLTGVDVQLIWPRLELDDPDMSLWHLPGLRTAECVLAAFSKAEKKNARAPLIRLSRTNFTSVPGACRRMRQRDGSFCSLGLGLMNAADPTMDTCPSAILDWEGVNALSQRAALCRWLQRAPRLPARVGVARPMRERHERSSRGLLVSFKALSSQITAGSSHQGTPSMPGPSSRHLAQKIVTQRLMRTAVSGRPIVL